MTKKTIIAKRSFIDAIKVEIASKRERHTKLFNSIKPEVVEKLRRMNNLKS